MYMKKNRYLLSIAITLMTGVAPLAAQTPQSYITQVLSCPIPMNMTDNFHLW